MAHIEDEELYKIAIERVSELLEIISNEKSISKTMLNELEQLGNMIADYEEQHYTQNYTS